MTGRQNSPDRPTATRGKQSQTAFWPFTSRAAVLTSPILLVVLLLSWGIFSDELPIEGVPAGWVLLGLVLISAMPIALLLLDGIATRGGSVEVGNVKIALTAGANRQQPVVVPTNAAPAGAVVKDTGSDGTLIKDSGSASILEALRRAATSDLVVIDLEAGQAWWETRLLLVCAGASRVGRPKVVVFVAIIGGKRKQFVGWALASQLLSVLLTNAEYRRRFESAASFAAAARLSQGVPPPVPVNISASQQWMAYEPLPADPLGRLLKPFLDEQLFANELAALEEAPREINVERLMDLFTSVLHSRSVDQNDRDADWFRKALLNDDEHLAITDHGTYIGLIPRSAIVSAVLLQLADS